MKKQYLLISLLTLTTALTQASNDMNSYDPYQQYQAQVQDALRHRYEGNSGYESGTENMGRIRNPRRADIGVPQEAAEYYLIKSNAPGFVADSPRQRFIQKLDEYLGKLQNGQISKAEFKATIIKKIDTLLSKINAE